MASSFRDLRVWQEAVTVADDVARRVAHWPSFERWSLGIQLVRAAESIAANIAEGAGRETWADKRRLYIIARGSLYETEHWILRAEALGLMPAGASRCTNEVARALNGLIRHPAPR
jgi:four helix bundle protein